LETAGGRPVVHLLGYWWMLRAPAYSAVCACRRLWFRTSRLHRPV